MPYNSLSKTVHVALLVRALSNVAFEMILELVLLVACWICRWGTGTMESWRINQTSLDNRMFLICERGLLRVSDKKTRIVSGRKVRAALEGVNRSW
jgi:hypothetical protein